MSARGQNKVQLEVSKHMNAMSLTSNEAASYIESMCSELAGLADRGGLGFLAYLLEVAREEALLHCDGASEPLVLHGELPPG